MIYLSKEKPALPPYTPGGGACSGREGKKEDLATERH